MHATQASHGADMLLLLVAEGDSQWIPQANSLAKQAGSLTPLVYACAGRALQTKTTGAVMPRLHACCILASDGRCQDVKMLAWSRAVWQRAVGAKRTCVSWACRVGLFMEMHVLRLVR